jgi:hypothetical protein
MNQYKSEKATDGLEKIVEGVKRIKDKYSQKSEF